MALALATGVLSIVFQGRILTDERIGTLRRWAWVWSGLNLLLAVSVYNRLFIYVGFNGLTRMRIIGFFGTTVVVVGFLLVLIKIRSSRGFWWLMRSQITALAVTLIVLALFPVDYVAHAYNVRTVNRGYLPPAVMVAVKDTNDWGLLPILKLMDCEDEIIREGVLAMLARRESELDFDSKTETQHWTRFQFVRHWLEGNLSSNSESWVHYRFDRETRDEAIERFQAYAMQWY